MTSVAQAQANQRNAKQSTGPRSDEGKQKASLNAITHGLASIDPNAYGPVDDEGRARLEAWKGVFPPRDILELTLVETVAAQGERIRRCQMVEDAFLREFKSRAVGFWDADNNEAAEELGRKIKRQPQLTTAKLRHNLHGTQWLLTRWLLFWKRFDDEGGWNDSLRAFAQDLLGHDAMMRLFKYSDEDLARQIQAETDRLQTALRNYAKHDLLVHDSAQKGWSGDLTKELKLVRRYESDAYRRRDGALEQLQELQKIHKETTWPLVTLFPDTTSDDIGFVSSTLDETPAEEAQEPIEAVAQVPESPVAAPVVSTQTTQTANSKVVSIPVASVETSGRPSKRTKGSKHKSASRLRWEEIQKQRKLLRDNTQQ